MVPNTDYFHLTPCTIYRAKTGNTVSEFTHYSSNKHMSLFLNCLIHFSFTSVHSTLEHGLVTLTESFSPH